MTGIELYSTTAASNNSATPNGWPEGQAPSTVNDCARQMMAATRTWYEDAEWIKWGDTTVYGSGTTFTIAGSDVTARYSVGRRVRAVGSSTGTIYGKIVTTAFSTNTTVTVVWDSGSLSNETLTISISETKGATASRSIDLDGITAYGAAVASATTVVLDNTTGDYVHITGTTTITAITLASGRRRKVVFDGILTLTHNATSLILPGGANITTAAGDIAEFEGEGSSNVRCLSYIIAANAPGGVPSSRTISAAGLAAGGGDLSANRTITVTAAVQADMETATSTTTAVVPGVVKNHPGVAKAWVTFDGTASTPITPLAQYGINGNITKNGTGDYSMTFVTAFSSTSYAVIGSGADNATTNCCVVGIDNGNLPTTTVARITTRKDNGVLTDFVRVNVVFFGDQ